MTLNDWWNAPCRPMGGCVTAFISSSDVVVWPVWRNPQDQNAWTLKAHHLKRDKWERITVHLCDNHTALAVQAWEVDTEADVNWMLNTDDWTIKNGGKL